ncbi:MAG: carbon-nitrogen hydrolase family protein [Pseudomonadales bacterium]|jgi:nitrilase|nr:carbon-nitrogen hydrolase family protein [Pseudomonadales bacterium]
MTKLAAIQMTSGPDIRANLEAAHVLLRQARAAGAELAALPENFAFLGRNDMDKRAVAEADGSGPMQDFLSATARDLRLWIVGGTLPLQSIARDGRVSSALLVFDADGQRVARYDKIHLFDVDLPTAGESYRESAHVAPGQAPQLVDTPAGKLGLAVCYDIRFPELFRRLSQRGAELFVLPSAFTVPTGQAHWEVLLRARAIENLAGLIAPAQWGTHPNGRRTYGDSMIVDHWGQVLARLPAGTGVVTAEIDLAEQIARRQAFPSLEHRVL